MAFTGLSPRASLIALIVIIIVAVLIIIEASWSLWAVNSTVGNETCNCSGISNSSLSSLRTFETIMLLLGIGLLIYAIVLLIIPTPEKRRSSFQSLGRRMERGTSQQATIPKQQ